MMMKKAFLLFSISLLATLCFISCGSSSHSDIVDPDPGTGGGSTDTQLTTVTYTPTADLFPNPERGFYSQIESDGTQALSLTQLKNYRDKNQTLIFRMYY